MDAEYELAADWHERGVAPEVVLLVSLGTLMLLGMVTQLMRQNSALVLPLIVMGAVTLGSLLMWQNTLREHLYVSRP